MDFANAYDYSNIVNTTIYWPSLSSFARAGGSYFIGTKRFSGMPATDGIVEASARPVKLFTRRGAGRLRPSDVDLPIERTKECGRYFFCVFLRNLDRVTIRSS